jgi:hypothetical protein
MNADIATAHFVASAEIQDSNLYEVQCPKGHSSYVILQQMKFELLFDIGACALLDGYYREAVTSFTSSLERFYEFFVRAALIQKKIDVENIESAWKGISKQSERQLGAYIIQYLSEFGTEPTTLGTNETKLRNDVVHHGKIPTRSEAIAYGQRILEIVRPAMLLAKERFSDGVQHQIWKHIASTQPQRLHGVATAFSCMPTIISLSSGEASSHERTLEEALNGLKMWTWLDKR